MIRQKTVLVGAVVATALASAACPGTLDDPARFADSAVFDASGCADIPTTLFATTCVKSGCHSTAALAQGLDLQSPNPASRLRAVTSTEGPGLLIDPSDVTKSVLYTKLTMVPPFGARMPLGMPPLAEDTLACVLAWISDAVMVSDGGAVDGGMPGDMDVETGGGADSGSESEGGASDGGAQDAPSRDAGSRDANVRDAAPTDAGSRG